MGPGPSPGLLSHVAPLSPPLPAPASRVSPGPPHGPPLLLPQAAGAAYPSPAAGSGFGTPIDGSPWPPASPMQESAPPPGPRDALGPFPAPRPRVSGPQAAAFAAVGAVFALAASGPPPPPPPPSPGNAAAALGGSGAGQSAAAAAAAGYGAAGASPAQRGLLPHGAAAASAAATAVLYSGTVGGPIRRWIITDDAAAEPESPAPTPRWPPLAPPSLARGEAGSAPPAAGASLVAAASPPSPAADTLLRSHPHPRSPVPGPPQAPTPGCPPADSGGLLFLDYSSEEANADCFARGGVGGAAAGGPCIEAGLLIGHRGPVTGLACTADGARVVSASLDGTVRLWEGVSGRCLDWVAAPAPVRCLAVAAAPGAPAAAFFACADGSYAAWDYDGRYGPPQGAPDAPSDSTGTPPPPPPSGGGSGGGFLGIYRGGPRASGGSSAMAAPGDSSGGHRSAAGVGPGSPRGEPATGPKAAAAGAAAGAAGAAGGPADAAGPAGPAGDAAGAPAGPFRPLLTPSRHRPVALATSPTFDVVFSGGEDGAVRALLCSHPARGPGAAVAAGAGAGAGGASPSPGGQAAGHAGPSGGGHRGWVRSLAVAPDGRCVFSGGDDGTVRLWGAPAGDDGGAAGAAGAGGWGAPCGPLGGLRLGASVSLTCLLVLPGPCSAPVASLACAPLGEGPILYGAVRHGPDEGGANVVAWEARARSMAVAASPASPGRSGIGGSISGGALMVAAEAAAARWARLTMWGPDRPHKVGTAAVAATPEGRWLATAGLDGALHLRRAADGRRVAARAGAGGVRPEAAAAAESAAARLQLPYMQ